MKELRFCAECGQATTSWTRRYTPASIIAGRPTTAITCSCCADMQDQAVQRLAAIQRMPSNHLRAA